MADALDLALLTVRYDSLIGSHLGETSSNLRRVLDHAACMPCVLFFDEFDAIGKERGDAQDVGEMKRVVASLLTQIDALPDHVVVLAATNHPEMLDRAVWRRFELRLELPMPDAERLAAYFDGAFRDPRVSGAWVAAQLGQLSFAEAANFVQDVRRARVLGSGRDSLADTVAYAVDARRQQFSP